MLAPHRASKLLTHSVTPPLSASRAYQLSDPPTFHSPSQSFYRNASPKMGPTISSHHLGQSRSRPGPSSTLFSVPASQTTSFANGFFHNLSSRVYTCILRQLTITHNSTFPDSCHSCYVRDLCSLALTSRAWDRETVRYLSVTLRTHLPVVSCS